MTQGNAMDARPGRREWVLAEIDRRLGLAAAATPGPWHPHFTIHGDPSVVRDVERFAFTKVCDVTVSPDDYGRANTAHIAASDPSLLGALYGWMRAEVEKHARYRRWRSGLLRWWCPICPHDGAESETDACPFVRSLADALGYEEGADNESPGCAECGAPDGYPPAGPCAGHPVADDSAVGGQPVCPARSAEAERPHVWRFDGDDPYIVCTYCGEVRDAHTGRVIRPPTPSPAPADDETHKCPTCGSPDPARHPAVQWEGEVQLCPDQFHSAAPSPAQAQGGGESG